MGGGWAGLLSRVGSGAVVTLTLNQPRVHQRVKVLAVHVSDRNEAKEQRGWGGEECGSIAGGRMRSCRGVVARLACSAVLLRLASRWLY